jgi:hypothetical protein
MARVPAVTPDGPKIRQLIWDHGWSVASFGGMLRPRSSKNTIYRIVYSNQRASVALVRRMAVVLGVGEHDITLVGATAEDAEPEPARAQRPAA